MAKTEYVTLRGRGFYCKFFEDNRDMEGYDGSAREHDGQYTVNLEMDSDNFNSLSATGSTAAEYAKETDDGLMSVKLKRKHVVMSRTGELLEWAGGAPKVFHKDGTTKWDREDDGLIGNGSELEVVVSVYKAGRAYGTRIEKVRVVDHVPYEELTGFNPDAD